MEDLSSRSAIKQSIDRLKFSLEEVRRKLGSYVSMGFSFFLILTKLWPNIVCYLRGSLAFESLNETIKCDHSDESC